METESTNQLIPFTGAVHPLKTETVNFQMPHGLTILEMLNQAQPNAVLLQDAVVFVDDIEVKREHWALIKPKTGCHVTARVIPYLRGGKNPLRLILSIIVISFALWAAPLLIGATALTGFAASFATAAVGALITTTGMLLVNAIAPIRPPSLNNSEDYADSSSLYLSGSSNTARPFSVIPSVLGFYRIRPPLAAKTFTEALGDKNRLRMLMTAGYGELELTEFEIGNTSLNNFDDFEIETRNGLVGDAPLSIYTKQVNQDGLSTLITTEYQFRTSDLDADELSIDIAFPQGLIGYNKKGGKLTAQVTFEIQYRKYDGTPTVYPWLNIPPGFRSTFGTAVYQPVNGINVVITGAKNTAVHHGLSWPTGERFQYEISFRIGSTAEFFNSVTVFNDAYLTTLRTITNEDPITFAKPLSKIALSIRSSDQLSGLVDNFSVFVKSVVLDWDSGSQTWINRVSNNPASLYRHVLQNPAKSNPLSDGEIDLIKLQEWHEFCDVKGFTFNMVRDFNTSVMSVLADIASAGRASIDLNDGNWSVIIDQPNPITLTHITPRNSSSFELEKAFIETPHAWRVRFPDESKRYEQAERIVYFEGFNEGTATVFQDLEFPGVTNSDHAWLQGRYHGAVVVHRPERWTVTQDFESLIARRGSRVKITHDVLLVGISSGRIKSLTLGGGGVILSLTVDEGLEMKSGNSYGLVIRRNVSGDVSLAVPINLVVGFSYTVTATTPIPAATAPEIGDLFSFGELGQETEDALVLLNTPESDFVGRIILVPYRAEIYDADAGAIPPYVPVITEEEFLPGVDIFQIVTDESVLTLGLNNTVMEAVEITVRPISIPDAFLQVQQRFNDNEEIYYDSETVQRTDTSIRISSVQTGTTLDLRVRWNSINLLPGPWTEETAVFVIGKSTDPAPLINPTLSTITGQAYIRWDRPIELDVQIGGSIEFRYSEIFNLLIPWSESVSIGQAAQAEALFISLPLKSGTYLARVIDSNGNRSTVSYMQTKQLDPLPHFEIITISEHPDFNGVHNDTVGIGGVLKLDDDAGEVKASGVYEFFNSYSTATVQDYRLTTVVTAKSINVISSEPDFAESDIQVWVRYSDNNEINSGLIDDWGIVDDVVNWDVEFVITIWSPFSRLDSAIFNARSFQFEARLTSGDVDYNIECTELSVKIEQAVI